MLSFVFFFQAEDGIRDRSPSRGLGDVYKRQDYSGIMPQRSVYTLSSPGSTCVRYGEALAPFLRVR